MGQGGILDRVRADVWGLPLVGPGRSDKASQPGDDSENREDDRLADHHRSHDDDCDDDFYDDEDHWHVCFHESDGDGCVLSAVLVGIASPWWYPHVVLNDHFGDPHYFLRFPYDGLDGYLTRQPPWSDGSTGPFPCEELSPGCSRSWSGRMEMNYGDTFDDLQQIEGRLLLDSASRFGADTQAAYLQENLPGGGHDELWLGDCNLVFRFAQSRRAAFRSGLGFNWLADGDDDQWGFNFTYGADFFPRRPWVVSTTLDWGTLGSAELFRFNASLGALIRNVEVYTGYQYLDIDTTQTNSLLAGLRVWF